jgi:uncharacterized phage protein gp47/JayE
METSKAKLREVGFRITNLRPGGVFYTLLEMANQGLADLYDLLKSVVPQLYVETATGDWLDLRAADFEVYRKLAQKTQGNVIFGRNAPGGNVVIPAGTIVATGVDRYGERLQFVVTTQTVLEEGSLEVAVPVEAEFAGARYNVGGGQINELVTYIAGIDYVTNTADWITREGTDDETDDELRARVKAKWAQLSVGGGRDAYIAWAQEVPGVVVVQVDDNQPRGQGTVDVIITGTAGLPSQALIDEVQARINERKPLCADVLVVAPTPVVVDITATVYVHPVYGDLTEIQAQAASIIDQMFNYGVETPGIVKASTEFGVPRAAIVSNLMTIEHVVNVALTAPAADVTVLPRELPVKGVVTITTQRVS